MHRSYKSSPLFPLAPKKDGKTTLHFTVYLVLKWLPAFEFYSLFRKVV
jgi:hypothetical protein